MTFNEWKPIYERLAKGRDKTPTIEQARAYFEVLENYSPGLVDKARERWNALNRVFPQASDLRDMCQSIISSAVYTPRECQTCGGNGWIDAPDQQVFGVVYSNFVKRCPVCYVPKQSAEVA